jgi:hypothetical protein
VPYNDSEEFHRVMIPVKKYNGELITVSKFEVPDDENT